MMTCFNFEQLLVILPSDQEQISETMQGLAHNTLNEDNICFIKYNLIFSQQIVSINTKN